MARQRQWCNPARVTVPTPSPARKITPLPAAPSRTVAQISAPCVTSGSSPASLMTPAVAAFPSMCVMASAKLGRSPRGSATATGSGKSPVTSAAKAALAAAAAQVPVVQPRRNADCCFATFAIPLPLVPGAKPVTASRRRQ